jgi:hypothetical protein
MTLPRSIALLLAFTLTPLASADPDWSTFDDAWLTHPPADPAGVNYDYHEILRNGHFDTGDLTHWVDRSVDAPDWITRPGVAGLNDFGPGGTNPFATPWTTGLHPMGAVSTLSQIGTLPGNATGSLLARFDAYTSFDRLDVHLDWLADDGLGGFVDLGTVPLGSFGDLPETRVDAYRNAHPIVEGATHVRFRAQGILTDGTWIDVGFDDASLVVASVVVPEPATAGLLVLLAGGTLLRRR